MVSSSSRNITIIGSGYVGMSLAILLSQHHKVSIVDINIKKVEKINSGISPIKDSMISDYLKYKDLNLRAYSSLSGTIESANIAIIATPTDYDEENNKFDTKSVDEAIKNIIDINKKALIIIKSTIPMGYVRNLQNTHKTTRIIFSPEFLREGQALHDNLYPSRIVVGGKCSDSKLFAKILLNASLASGVEVLFTGPEEAEAIKLFSNTYLAMRVAFFNELDSYALSKGINTSEIINGVSMDSRIGKHYNNPSFGYGGYCLPKDTKQLLANFEEIPQTLITSVIKSNQIRKKVIANEIIKRKAKKIGFYKLSMKKGSDNFRSSSIIEIINIILQTNSEIIIHEPFLEKNTFNGAVIENNLEVFKKNCDLIVCNRISEKLTDVQHKVFSRDIFKEN